MTFIIFIMRQDFNNSILIPILKRNDVEFAGIFGSYARGEAREESDVDVLIKFAKPKSLLKIVRLERELSEAAHKKVDLVTENALSPYLKEAVLREVKVFYGKR